MATSAVVLPIAALIAIGGPAVLMASLNVDGMSAITLWTRQESLAAGIGFVIGLAGIGLGYPGQPHVVEQHAAQRGALVGDRVVVGRGVPAHDRVVLEVERQFDVLVPLAMQLW